MRCEIRDATVAYSIDSFGISHCHKRTLHNNVDRALISSGRVEIPVVGDQLAKILGFLRQINTLIQRRNGHRAYQQLSASSNLHEGAILENAMIIDDPRISNHEGHIFSVVDMSPGEGLDTMWTGIVRELCDWDGHPVGTLSKGGELRHGED